MLCLSAEEFRLLSPSTQTELLARLQGVSTAALSVSSPSNAASAPAEIPPEVMKAFDWKNRPDLSLEQIEEWMTAAQGQTKLGMRIIAEHGPVFDFNLLEQGGVKNRGQFQSRTTLRTRTVTKNPEAFLLTWDDWTEEDGKWKTGNYAVTPMTHQSLRKYFKLD